VTVAANLRELELMNPSPITGTTVPS
jgi:hypothetical protein